MIHTTHSSNHTNFGGDFFWVPDGGLMFDALSEAVVARDIESSIFDDGCSCIAEGSVWDAWAGTYLGTAEPRFARFAEYIEHPAYSGVA
ncbi:hypothetical protein [Rubrobacter indicoceani]|uniref:hypothetical protein n=1 Tax=Rubrobacter indicoceani TaxID=2051957 RepID=UPI000E5C09DE|nr:hypothetical protein [Rubrobacter indicoceani]